MGCVVALAPSINRSICAYFTVLLDLEQWRPFSNLRPRPLSRSPQFFLTSAPICWQVCVSRGWRFLSTFFHYLLAPPEFSILHPILRLLQIPALAIRVTRVPAEPPPPPAPPPHRALPESESPPRRAHSEPSSGTPSSSLPTMRCSRENDPRDVARLVCQDLRRYWTVL